MKSALIFLILILFYCGCASGVLTAPEDACSASKEGDHCITRLCWTCEESYTGRCAPKKGGHLICMPQRHDEKKDHA